ncbi:type III secretion system (T3SS) SseB-like protein [Herbihabitans rhizosphaerae]|uniref:Type III secretion system (T3SS) SseB-like protein n=1 Tax=Herbihabitans rhizosphaerae TaxID=1872711 RepID=A0A4Q7KK98_9PSEU|nr:SAV_915 family protein [Herbihabitans rhizosphaerae]RZS36979.1 type III secretion system (T3SS) SseB-like protein [Herbihabitans rhizosphaerae]
MPGDSSAPDGFSVAPSVLGGEMAGVDADDVPDQLFTPTATAVAGDDVTLVLRELEDGRRAMLVYTSLEKLVAGCGDEQPWMAFRAEALHTLQHTAGASDVYWDALLDPAVRQYGSFGEESDA